MTVEMSMDGNLEHDTAKEVLGNLKFLPHTIKLKNGYNLVGSFCLKCKARNVDGTKTIHADCGGAVPLIYAPLKDPTNALDQTKAREAVESAQFKLETDDNYLAEMREKYAGFKQ